MKLKIVCLSLAALAAVTGCMAQRNKKAQVDLGAKEMQAVPQKTATAVKMDAAPVAPKPAEMTEECQENISIFAEAAKQKNYAEALSPWEYAFANCKGTNRAIYTYGAKIVEWQISQENDEAKKSQLVDKLLSVYDEQIVFFGKDPKYPTAYIQGQKALTLNRYRSTDLDSMYSWAAQSVHGLKGASSANVLQCFVTSSYAKYKADSEWAEHYFEDYFFADEILEANSANTTLKNAAAYGQVNENVDKQFVSVADCDQLDKTYASQIEANKTNYDFLVDKMQVYKQVNCRESEVYCLAAEYAHNIQPTAESAAGCAAMSYKKGEYEKAIEYYNESASLDDNAEDIADCYFKIAQIYNSKLNNRLKAREYARKSLEQNPNQGEPYLLIGLLYASTQGIYDSPVLNKTVYWVAVDKFVKAKQVDPEIADKANELIRVYSARFPSKEDIFYVPELQDGKSFFVGGWIGENTICR